MSTIKLDSGIRLDKQGQFWHEGRRVTHEGLRQALFRWLDQHADGRYVLALDAQRFCYLEVEDAPFLVTAISPVTPEKSDSPLQLMLNSGQSVPLKLSSLELRGPGALYARVGPRALLARFLPAPYHQLLLAATPLDHDRYLLQIGTDSVILSEPVCSE